MGKTVVLSLLLLLSGFSFFECSKILIFYPFSTKSHLNTLMPVADELVARGHEIDFITRYKDYKVNPAIRVQHVSVVEDIDNAMEEFLQGLNKFSFLIDLLSTGIFVEQVCESVLTNNDIKSLIDRGKQYDVVFTNAIMSDCALAVSYMIANHTIVSSAGSICPWSFSPSPRMPSVLPNFQLPLPPTMTFKQRIFNFLFMTLTKAVATLDVYPRANAIVQKYYPGTRSVQEAWRDASLYFENIDNIIFSPRPSAPRIINLSGSRCKKNNPLPQEMESFIKESGEDGFIVFSFGSIADAGYLKKETLEQFSLAFSKIKQRVIWKFGSTTMKLPSNVRTFKWLPQSDLLGHEKARLFITHGGLLGLQEAICYGVPIIGFPLFADQPGNLARAQELGIGEMLDIATLSAEELLQTIQKILQDDSYRQNARKYAPILKDHLEPAAKKGAYWVEYVIRHQGAKHLRSPGEEMSLFEYFLVDVIGSILLVTGLCCFFSFKLVKLILVKLRRKKVTSQNHNKKTN